MYNTLSDIKQSLQFKAVDLDLDDTKQLSSGLTAYEEWLTDMAEQSKELMQKWGVNNVEIKERKLKRAEILLITAFAIENHEITNTLDPESFETLGEKRTYKKLTLSERAEKVKTYKDNAYFLLFGKYPDITTGIIA